MSDEVLESPRAAYDRGRAEEQKHHRYHANMVTGIATCACGVEEQAEFIGDHIEKFTEQAGLVARDAAEAAIRRQEREKARGSV